MPPGQASVLSRLMPHHASLGVQKFLSKHVPGMRTAVTRGHGDTGTRREDIKNGSYHRVAASSPLGGSELHQGPLWCDIIKDCFQRHVHPECVDVALHDIRHQARTLVKLYDCVDIGNVLPEGGVCRLLHDGEAVQSGSTADLHPLQVGG